MGQTRTPDWVANLRAEPNCAVIIDKTRTRVRAIELAGDERDRGWELFGEELPKLKARMAAYERRSQRRIPVFRLEVR